MDVTLSPEDHLRIQELFPQGAASGPRYPAQMMALREWIVLVSRLVSWRVRGIHYRAWLLSLFSAVLQVLNFFPARAFLSLLASADAPIGCLTACAPSESLQL